MPRHATQTVDPDFVILSWENSVDENTLSEQTAGFILGTLVHVIDGVSGHAAVSLADHLLDLLQGFRCAPGLISSLIQCSVKLSLHNAGGDVARARKSQAEWMGQLVKRCDACLRNFVFSKRELNADAVVAHLHTLGELALIGVRDDNGGSSSSNAATGSGRALFAIPDSTVASLKTLVAPRGSEGGAGRNAAAAAEGGEGEGIENLGEGDGDGEAGALTIKAFAFVALGKVAFRSQPLAKSCIGVFIRELMTAREPVLRNNILVVLGDLCRHFTGLVDPYVGNMAQCLGDAHIGVRKNALLLLTELLLEDFIKWRGPLLFQFLTVLLDDSDELRDLAHQAVFGLFSARDKNLVANRFVGFVHVLNNSSLARGEMDGADAEAASRFFRRFYGQGAGRRHRYHLYRAVLEEMDSEQKFKVSARLTADVLSATVDGALALKGNDCAAPSYNVLQDVLAILSSKAISIPNGAAGAAAAAAGTASAMGEEVSAETALGAVKDKLLSKISHKNAMQNTIPVLVALRGRLQEARSPLLKDLNAFLTSIFRTHRADVAKALAEDPQLAAEIKCVL
jgi:condensin-2 complex subunit D3